MTETQDQEKPKTTLTLGKKLELKKSGEGDQVRQSFSHGRSKTVAVEVKRRRVPVSPQEATPQPAEPIQVDTPKVEEPKAAESVEPKKAPPKNIRGLSQGEIEARMRAIQEAGKYEAKAQEERSKKEAEEAQWRKEMEELERQRQDILDREKGDAEETPSTVVPETVSAAPVAADPVEQAESSKPTEGTRSDHHHKPVSPKTAALDEEEEAMRRKGSAGKIDVKKAVVAPVRRDFEQPRKLDRQTITRALSDEGVERSRSLASIKRHRQKQKIAHQGAEAVKILRDVIIPDTITVAELANRMAVRSADVIKSLMKLGMMVTINQVIDADTAELICSEFGHKFKRVSESDIEIGLKGDADDSNALIHRAPVVTVMGHVDHGKTSLLDALRKTDVVSGEAGGITQHIGAYQITVKSGQKITFIDTPGHAAFTEMRARGANVTDIVILVVAADDGIMEQTVEAINHAKAAQVPIIVAINKIDKPDANADRVRNELLQHGLVLEEFGGDLMAVEVSAKTGVGLDKLEETILLQAEVLELQANPNRAAEGVVIEAEIDRGRGTVSTVLVQRGSLKLGDVFVAGSEWGRVRALVDDHGRKIDKATPSMPIEVIGFNGVPSAGDEFFVVEDEARAREVAEYRQRKNREAKAAASARGNMEQMMSRIAAGEIKELPVVIKSDVQGSLEAITASLAKLATEEVAIRVLHGGVGGINESDITLARASNAVVIGFNVRANPQARDLSRRDNVEIRYYSIIYDVLDDLKAVLGGLLAPTVKEKYLGSMEIRQIFTVGKLGKIAGCYVLDGLIKRGAKVRLLRDSVVIHEGSLKSLRRFKDEVKEVRESYECGVVLENYNDIREKDVIECFEMESVARQL